jgi:hypothetical protein
MARLRKVSGKLLVGPVVILAAAATSRSDHPDLAFVVKMRGYSLRVAAAPDGAKRSPVADATR